MTNATELLKSFRYRRKRLKEISERIQETTDADTLATLAEELLEIWEANLADFQNISEKVSPETLAFIIDYYILGLTLKQIGQAEGCCYRSISRRHSDARKELQEQLTTSK